MIRWWFVLLFAVSSASSAPEKGRFLSSAILTLPARYMADISEASRPALLALLSRSSDAQMLDYRHGWLHYYSDNPYEDFGSSMLWIKLLPRQGKTPLVFVHMAKPFADGRPPSTSQTFVLERDAEKWVDVTSTVFPKSIDLTMAFIPRRLNNDIQVAPYKRLTKRNSSGRDAYTFGRCSLVLRWTGKSFDVDHIEPRNLNFNT